MGFVVISGLPGSGKSTLARHLAPLLNLPVIDKDDLLDGLFERKGIGDDAWRRRLSRESDLMLESKAAAASRGAMLVSFWHLPGMPADSGTPTEWLPKLSPNIIHVHCVCSALIAAERFFKRKRHPGHLDSNKTYEEVLARIQATERLGPFQFGRRLDVDTSHGITPDTCAQLISVLALQSWLP